MSDVARPGREFGAGPLSRASARVYTLLVVEALLLVSIAPGLLLTTVLAHDPSNLPLLVLAAVPLGPALSAALVALDRQHDLADLHPAAVFGRTYRRNTVGVLRLWVPMLMALTVIGINLTHWDAAGLPAGWAVLLGGIAVAVTVWGLTALVISTFFTFRTRDTARLAWYLLARTPGVTWGTGGLLIVAGAVIGLWSEAVLALLGSVFAWSMLHTFRPAITVLKREFTG
jgi:hypothetical protein